jgi:hypothetical protein
LDGIRDAKKGGMNPQKIILHRLNSPWSWDEDRAERSRVRRKVLQVISGVVFLLATAAVLHREDTVENYAGSAQQHDSERTAKTRPMPDSGVYLADTGRK